VTGGAAVRGGRRSGEDPPGDHAEAEIVAVLSMPVALDLARPQHAESVPVAAGAAGAGKAVA
jgi:hypothetical protein